MRSERKSAIDPALISAGPWANRLEDSFQSEAFASLKKEIEEAGRNVQPIKVRPIAGSVPQQYQIVFGHRRHRACLDLGLPVWAFIESLDDSTTFVEMERENRQRANLSPYEQGRMYVRGVELFGSMRKLSERIGRDVSDISKAIAIATLPSAVIEAFPSANDLQFRWAKALTDASSKDAAGLLERAQTVVNERAAGKKLSAQEVLSKLTATEGMKTRAERELKVGERVIATLMVEKGRVVLTFPKGVLAPDDTGRLEEAIRKLFG
jgi:ParB family transcriptional regulator, chromosome partitioning protein